MLPVWCTGCLLYKMTFSAIASRDYFLTNFDENQGNSSIHWCISCTCSRNQYSIFFFYFLLIDWLRERWHFVTNFGDLVSISGFFRPFKVSNLKTPFFYSHMISKIQFLGFQSLKGLGSSKIETKSCWCFSVQSNKMPYLFQSDNKQKIENSER